MLNILPQSKKTTLQREALLRRLVQWCVAAVVSVCVLYGLALFSNQRIQRWQEEAQQQRGAALALKSDQAANLEREVESLRNALTTFEQAERSTVNASEVLTEILASLPENTQLQSLQYDVSENAIILRGIALDREDFNRIQTSMQSVPVFATMQLTQVDIDKQNDISYEFSVTIDPMSFSTETEL